MERTRRHRARNNELSVENFLRSDDFFIKSSSNLKLAHNESRLRRAALPVRERSRRWAILRTVRLGDFCEFHVDRSSAPRGSTSSSPPFKCAPPPATFVASNHVDSKPCAPSQTASANALLQPGYQPPPRHTTPRTALNSTTNARSRRRGEGGWTARGTRSRETASFLTNTPTTPLRETLRKTPTVCSPRRRTNKAPATGPRFPMTSSTRCGAPRGRCCCVGTFQEPRRRRRFFSRRHAPGQSG